MILEQNITSYKSLEIILGFGPFQFMENQADLWVMELLGIRDYLQGEIVGFSNVILIRDVEMGTEERRTEH